MAISKTITGADGFDRTYHRIRDVHVFADKCGKMQVQMVVESYKDKDARKSGADALVRQCSITDADFAMTPFYKLLAGLFPEYGDGNDDFDDSWKDKKTTHPMMITQSADGKLIERHKEINDGIKNNA